MVVYVTGAAGFLGSHLVERLLNAGHTVLGIDNLVTGDRANLRSVEGRTNFALILADAGEKWAFLDRVPHGFASPELIVHAASPASPIDYGRDPLGTLHVNAVGSMEAVALARRTGARIFYFSTSECYGDPLEHPQSETYWGNVNPIGARACYDEGKRFGEAYLTSAARAHGIDVRIVRIFNTYGPRMQADDGRVIPNFCMSALRGEPLTIYGDGSQTRSFCFVNDLIEGIVRFIFSPRAAGRVVNIGNPSEYTIRELASVVAEIACVPLNVVERALPPDDPTRRRPDISVARELLDWEPSVALREGLRATLDYFRETVRAGERSRPTPR